MRSIVLARIDDRLIHGQVVTAWCKTTGANAIVIADDDLVCDEFSQRLLKACAPPGITVHTLSLSDASIYLRSTGEGDERIILLTKTPGVMEYLLEEGVSIGRIILGGMGMKAGRKRFNKNVSASEEEISSMKRIVSRGVDINYQMVPKERPVNVKKLLSKS
ncbi:MAG TPA: PTS sugar transporter subunit IIB [Clostridiaceae bacterium]|nr:PTS sugar transporter subunit IIB [Clostridiaceae bacterium]